MSASHGFVLLREQALRELNSTARFYRHARTGAELLSLVNGDENKVFGVTFRTLPRDSNGIAHILEHSVLCGSRKYPVKDPFVQLMKGSLNTFLNAFTYPDKTCYPVASQNLQDFYNLIDVYLDAVFHPRITPHILQQEGWHYELDAIDAPLIYKGVVFNEMKGNYSSPDSVLADWSQRSLFPDTTYGVDYGGDPGRIPDLTYAEFKAFHERNYHPSAARLFFYGDDDPHQRLRLLDARLSEFESIKVDGTVALQTRFRVPKRLTRTYAAGAIEPDARKAMVTVNWMLDEISDLQTGLGLTMLHQVLVGTPASPLYKALINSGLGDDIAGRGLDDELRQATFSTGLKNLHPGDADKVETLILDTLRTLAEQGIDAAAIEAAVNTVEFALARKQHRRPSARHCGDAARPQVLALWSRSPGAAGIRSAAGRHQGKSRRRNTLLRGADQPLFPRQSAPNDGCPHARSRAGRARGRRGAWAPGRGARRHERSRVARRARQHANPQTPAGDARPARGVGDDTDAQAQRPAAQEQAHSHRGDAGRADACPAP